MALSALLLALAAAAVHATWNLLLSGAEDTHCAAAVAIGLDRSARPRDLVLALSVGACIAGYTLVDKQGIRYGAPISYLELVFGATAGA